MWLFLLAEKAVYCVTTHVVDLKVVRVSVCYHHQYTYPIYWFTFLYCAFSFFYLTITLILSAHLSTFTVNHTSVHYVYKLQVS